MVPCKWDHVSPPLLKHALEMSGEIRAEETAGFATWMMRLLADNLLDPNRMDLFLDVSHRSSREAGRFLSLLRSYPRVRSFRVEVSNDAPSSLSELRSRFPHFEEYWRGRGANPSKTTGAINAIRMFERIARVYFARRKFEEDGSFLYHTVTRARPDVLLTAPWPIEALGATRDTVYTHACMGPKNDQFATGSRLAMEAYDSAALAFARWNGSYLGPEGSLWRFANLSVATVDRRRCTLSVRDSTLDLRSDTSSPLPQLVCVSRHRGCVLDCDAVALAGDPHRPRKTARGRLKAQGSQGISNEKNSSSGVRLS